MQIIVLGMHRSGTSAAARLLNLMGAYFGAEDTSTGASEENEKGFWERNDVRALNDSILHNANCDWDRIADFEAESIPSELLDQYRSRAREIILNLDAHRPWFIKEPRLCLLFPVWEQQLEIPFCVHVVRNPVEVAQSLEARNGIPIKAGLALWEVYNKQAIAASATLPRHFLSYADLMASPRTVAEALGNALESHCGYKFRVPSQIELEAFVDQGLYRQRSDDDSIGGTATRSQAVLHQRLAEAVACNEIDLPPITKSCINTLRRFESSGEHLAARMRRSNARERANRRNTDPRLTLKSMELDRALADANNRRAALQERDRVISQMRSDAQNYKTQLAVKNQVIEQLNSEARRLKSDLSSKDQALADANTKRAALQERDRVISQMKSDAKDYETRLAANNQAIEQLNSEARRLESDLSSKDQALADANTKRAALQERDRVISQMKSDAKDYETRLAANNQAIEQLNSEARRLESDLSSKDRALADADARCRRRLESSKEADADAANNRSLNSSTRRLADSSRICRPRTGPWPMPTACEQISRRGTG